MKKNKEIVINNCFGGFGLSDEAFEMYLKLKGIKYYKYSSWLSSDYYTVPKEKYERLSKKWREEDGDYKRINAKNWLLSYRNIKRDDPILIKVVKKLKKKANGRCSSLKIVKIPSDVKWEINEYDGLETIHEIHRNWR